MKRYLGWFAVLVVVAGVTVSLLALPQRAAWTTDSEEALEEFLAGLESEQKLYHVDAAMHFERALKLDPDFTAARLFLVDLVKEVDKDEGKELLDTVLATPTDRLSDRERLLIERVRAIHDKRYEDAHRLVDEYLEEHPDDPYVLNLQAMTAWIGGDLERAERLFRRLVEIDPNRVIAYNQLGYIAMRQGRFAEAEEYFTSYRFVAPDQANPHDSLGELYIIQGRYSEAVASLERALEIRPDFLASYDHLVTAYLIEKRFDDARRVADALADQEGVPPTWNRMLDCIIRVAVLADAGRWQEVVELEPDCLWEPLQGYLTMMVHRAAVRTGDVALAERMERDIEALLEEQGSYQKWMVQAEAILDHLRGARAAGSGDLKAAEALLSAADDRFQYGDVGAGLFKLMNRLLLVEVRLAAGRDAEAHALLSRVRHVNPVLVEDFEDRGLRMLGLERH